MDLCPLSKWKNIFGKIREGPHSFRFLDIALVDYFLTIALSFFILIWCKYKHCYMVRFELLNYIFI